MTLSDVIRRREVGSTAVFAAGLLLLIVALGAGRSGTVWNGIHLFYFAVFGITGFFVPPAILFRGITDVLGISKRGHSVKIIEIFCLLAVVVLVIILNGGTRKIPVQYAKKIQGRKTVGGQSSCIPLKVNTSGVIPIIFASSLMQLPVVICSFFGIQGTGFWGHVLRGLSSSNWCNPKEPVYSIGLVVYIALVIFFAYFYTSITFNPLEIADNMKKSGGFIPGIRPGKPTSDYLTKILNYIVFIGAIGLTIVCVIPFIFNGVFGAQVSFGGTSLIIIVSVILETMKQVESQMLVRNYKGFLNN